MPSNPRLREMLAALRREMERIYGERLAKMILYGSQARGDAGRWSDIDVLVVLKGPFRPSEEVSRTGQAVSEICLEYDAVIHCFFLEEMHLSEITTPLIWNILVEGMEVR